MTAMDDQKLNYERRRSLDKMRSKLVSAGTRPAGRPGLTMYAEGSGSGSLKARSVMAAMLLLVAVANVYSYLERDEILTKVDPLPPKLAFFEPSAKWTADEKAMFWAYAAFSPAKFDSRFGPVPEDKLMDRRKAAKLARALFEKGGLNPIVESELKALLEANKPRSAKAVAGRSL